MEGEFDSLKANLSIPVKKVPFVRGDDYLLPDSEHLLEPVGADGAQLRHGGAPFPVSGFGIILGLT